jgi:hypothetical protein
MGFLFLEHGKKQTFCKKCETDFENLFESNFFFGLSWIKTKQRWMIIFESLLTTFEMSSIL